MDTQLLDAETDTERNLRHRAALTALLEKVSPRSSEYRALREEQRLEWAEHPTEETLNRRLAEKGIWTIAKTDDDTDEDQPRRFRPRGRPRVPKGNQPVKGVAAPSRRGLVKRGQETSAQDNNTQDPS